MVDDSAGSPADRGDASNDDAAQTRAFLDSLLAAAPGPGAAGGLSPWPGREPQLSPPHDTRRAFVVRLDLDQAKPPIWRRLRLASDMPLERLHDVIQVTMGWADAHLHKFLMGPGARDWNVAPFITDFDLAEGETGIHERDVRLDQVLASPGDRLYYEYDFGDGWHHTVKLEKVEDWNSEDPEALCLAGKRACPPEDVGGVWGYHEVLDALNGKVDPDEADYMADKLEWMPPNFDPEQFDVDSVNAMLDRPSLSSLLVGVTDEVSIVLSRGFGASSTLLEQLAVEALDGPSTISDDDAARATHRFQVLMAAIGDGLDLTGAGWLPPSVVVDLARQLKIEYEWYGKLNREDHTRPIAELRQAAQSMGLVRKTKGRLTVPRAIQKITDDPHALLRHVASRLPSGRREDQKEAGILALLNAAAGRPWRIPDALTVQIFAGLGWTTATPLELKWSLNAAAEPTTDVLLQLAGGRQGRLSPDLARFLLQDQASQ